VKRLSAVLIPAFVFLACREESQSSPAPSPRDRDASTTDGATSPTAGRDASPEVPLGPAVTVASLNVHRLFDTVCDSGQCGGGAYEELPSRAAFDRQVAELGAGIRKLGPDIMLLQEIENQNGLDALAREVPEMPHAFLAETGGPASVDVAILSRYPLREVIRHTEDRFELPNGDLAAFSRDLLEAHVETPIGEVVCFVAHLRSKVNDDPDRRFAEALAARRIVTETAAAYPTAIVLLGGDFNDVPGSRPIEALTDDGGLERVSEGLQTSEIGTNRYAGNWLAIDHFFLARHFVGRSAPGSFEVFREANAGYAGSDHGAIRAKFSR
jgi:endonuclease/exonuclease/phosphatase family metal-dependent hydrolase